MEKLTHILYVPDQTAAALRSEGAQHPGVTLFMSTSPLLMFLGEFREPSSTSSLVLHLLLLHASLMFKFQFLRLQNGRAGEYSTQKTLILVLVQCITSIKPHSSNY